MTKAEILLYLHELVKRSNPAPVGEDFFIDDWAAGNIDDAYALGQVHGENAVVEEIIDFIQNFS